MFGFLPSPKSCGVPGAASLYRAHFCGLCNVLRSDYGLWARGIINRDSTFLALLGAAQCETLPQAQCATCCNPFGTSRPLHQTGATAHYAAAVTLCGLSSKLDDDADDERGPRRWLAHGARFCLDGSVTKAMGFLHAVGFPVARVNGLLGSQAAIEHPTASLAEAAVPTREAFGEIVAHTGIVAGCEPSQHSLLRQLGEQLGFLIYAKDAWDDFGSDAKRGRFNPLHPLPAESDRRAFLLPQLQHSAQAISDSFAKLQLHRYHDTLHSIVVDGVHRRIAAWMGLLPPPSLPYPPPVPPPSQPGQHNPSPSPQSPADRTCSQRCSDTARDCRDDCCNRRGQRSSRCRDHCCDSWDCIDCARCCDGCHGCHGCDCGGCDCDCGH